MLLDKKENFDIVPLIVMSFKKGGEKLKIILFIFIFMTTWSLAAKELVVGLADEDYPPFYFVKNGKLQGSSLEITQIVAKKLGYKLIFRRYPWARVLENLKTGKIDLVVHLFKTAERATSVFYVGVPHIFETSGLFVPKGSPIQYTGNLELLKTYKFANIRGYSHGKTYDSADYLNKNRVTSEVNLIRMLLAHRVDLGVGNKSVILWHAKKLKVADKIKFLTPALHDDPCYIAFSRIKPRAKALASAFTAELVRFKKTRQFKKIIKKYNFDQRKN